MLGHDHAVIGASTGLLVALKLKLAAGFAATMAEIQVPIFGHLPNLLVLVAADVTTFILAVGVGAIAALVPDLDSHSSTLGALLPKALHWFLPKHRQGSHSLLATWGSDAGTYALVNLVILTGAASVPQSAAVVVAVAAHVGGQMAAMVAYPYLSHLAADGITEEGCRWFYVPELVARFLPAKLRALTEAHFGIPLFKTGEWPERVITSAFAALALVLFFDLQDLLPRAAATLGF